MATNWNEYLDPHVAEVMQKHPDSVVGKLCRGVIKAADRYIAEYAASSQHLAHLAATQAADKCAKALYG